MSELIIAAQLFTLRDLLNGKSEKEIFEVLGQVKDMGYTAIQVSGVGEVTPDLATIYKKAADELQLDICATHFGLEYIEENIDWVIEVHKLWNCEYMGIGSMPEPMRDALHLDEFASRCNKIGRDLKEHGLTLVYHNHKFEFEKADGKPWLQILLEKFDDTCVQLEIDTYWIQAGGANPVDWIKKVSGNMGIVHFKDMRIVKDEQQFAEIGNATLTGLRLLKRQRQLVLSMQPLSKIGLLMIRLRV